MQMAHVTCHCKAMIGCVGIHSNELTRNKTTVILFAGGTIKSQCSSSVVKVNELNLIGHIKELPCTSGNKRTELQNLEVKVQNIKT